MKPNNYHWKIGTLPRQDDDFGRRGGNGLRLWRNFYARIPGMGIDLKIEVIDHTTSREIVLAAITFPGKS
jgi:hypothetical protein